MGQNVISTKGTNKLLRKWRDLFRIREVHQEGVFYRLSTGRALHFENIKLHNSSTAVWSMLEDTEKGDYFSGPCLRSQ